MRSIILLLALRVAGAQTTLDFQRSIRPLLSENCFQCHGPDAGTRMAGLRLDLKEGAARVIVPGKPESSLLFQRVSASDPAFRMPPESSHKSLNERQVALIRQWITQGATWQEHWAFRAPVMPKPPSVRNPLWVKTPIDRFILAKLEAQGLAPAPAADRRTLIRRVALDVTGLPPSPAEIETYLKDTSPNAYEHMVDRYLASPHYGEQRAHYWLDAARYGDTHGIHIDNYREIWPYRDWVIGAFNRDLPFSQFSIEQLAGDLLPNPTLDQRIATGFLRCGVTTNEAGIIEDEYAEIYAKDRADTTSAVWLGMTVGCATCHDHKFDPISQKDFYSLGAFFRNTTQKVMDGNVADTPPAIFVPDTADRTRWDRTRKRMDQLRELMEAERSSAQSALAEWKGEKPKQPLDGEELFTADIRALAAGPGDQRLGESNVHGMPALMFGRDGGVNAEKAPKLDAGQPFSVSVSFLLPVPDKPDKSYVITSQSNGRDRGRGWALDVNGKTVGFRMTADGGRSIEIRTEDIGDLHFGGWNHVVATYDGSRSQSGLGLYVNGGPPPIRPRATRSAEILGDISVDNPLVVGRTLTGGAVADLRIYHHAVNESEARVLSEWPGLSTWYAANHDDRYRALAKELTDLDADVNAMERRGSVTLVMQERTDSKPFAHILYRGAYDQRRERVEASTPAVLPPMTASMPRNRLGFAQWLFTDDHPLTARVAVNRMWQEIFGTGIVKTVDDFGSQGEPPSNQDLLDWLAVDFRQNGWDMKRFYRQILLSAAYRQSAVTTPEKLAKDPDNRLLSRGARYRMDGEMVRDYALSASGLLAPGVGGPSVKPYQPDGVWEAVAMKESDTRFYKQDAGDGLHRRSLYTFWKRSAPPASMDIFNAPTRESCTMRRERTDTPLQALVTMNDPQFVEAARELAGHAMQASADFDAQLGYISVRLLARPLSLKEKEIARRSYEGFRARYEDNAADAAAVLGVGATRPDPSLPPADFAAMTMLTNQLMNLDEVLNR